MKLQVRSASTGDEVPSEPADSSPLPGAASESPRRGALPSARCASRQGAASELGSPFSLMALMDGCHDWCLHCLSRTGVLPVPAWSGPLFPERRGLPRSQPVRPFLPPASGVVHSRASRSRRIQREESRLQLPEPARKHRAAPGIAAGIHALSGLAAEPRPGTRGFGSQPDRGRGLQGRPGTAEIFRIRPDNTFQVKISYWLNTRRLRAAWHGS